MHELWEQNLSSTTHHLSTPLPLHHACRLLREQMPNNCQTFVYLQLLPTKNRCKQQYLQNNDPLQFIGHPHLLSGERLVLHVVPHDGGAGEQVGELLDGLLLIGGPGGHVRGGGNEDHLPGG